MLPQAHEILKRHSLRVTACRQKVIELFLEKAFAVGQPELERRLTQFDRVTIYRTLSTFMEKGIIHQVLDDDNSMKYALCAEECTAHVHQDHHVHFKCTSCQLIQCLDEVEIPKVDLPQGFQFMSADFLIKGVCNSCSILA